MTTAPEADGLHWFKSSRSAQNGACVEVAVTDQEIAVRDSKDPRGARLSFTAPAWRDFIGAVRAGAFDPPATR